VESGNLLVWSGFQTIKRPHFGAESGSKPESASAAPPLRNPMPVSLRIQEAELVQNRVLIVQVVDKTAGTRGGWSNKASRKK
jgi:hypothetical protein